MAKRKDLAQKVINSSDTKHSDQKNNYSKVEEFKDYNPPIVYNRKGERVYGSPILWEDIF